MLCPRSARKGRRFLRLPPKFAGGKAAAVAIAFGCTDECSEGFAEATVRLRRGGKF